MYFYVERAEQEKIRTKNPITTLFTENVQGINVVYKFGVTLKKHHPQTNGGVMWAYPLKTCVAPSPTDCGSWDPAIISSKIYILTLFVPIGNILFNMRNF